MGFMDWMGDVGDRFTQGWTGPNMLGAGLSLLPLITSAFQRPAQQFQRFDPRTPQQMTGLGNLASAATQQPPQWNASDLETAMRLAAMQGAGQAASRGLQVPGGGMVGAPQTISSEAALRAYQAMQGQNLQMQQQGQQQRTSAAGAMAGSPGFSYVQRPSVFNQAMQAGMGFGSMIPQPMNRGGGAQNPTPWRTGMPPDFQDAMDEMYRSQWPTQ